MGNPHLIASLFTNRHTAPGLAISVIVLAASLVGSHFACADQAGQTSGEQLHEAAKTNDITALETLIAGGADIDARDENGQTPLMCALKEHALAAAAVLLINHGASVAARDFHKNWTPLHYAAYYYRMPDIAELLINHGASVTARDNAGWTPLHNALTGSGLYIGDDFRSSVLTLFERGAPVDAETTVSGWKPLHMAVWLRDQAIVGALIKHGANVNAQMMLGGVTPLHLALHQLKVIPDQARQWDWSQARLEEQLNAADEVVAVLRAAGAVDRVDKTAFPRIISNGWFKEKRFETYPQPDVNIRFSTFEIPPFSIKGSFTAKGGEERLISEPIGYVDGFSLFGFASMTGILDKEGRMNYQWVADAAVDEPELCFDALSGLDHVRLRLHPLGSAHHTYSIYMHYDADSGQLVEGFDNYWFGHRTAEPDEDGACNWRKAKQAVETYKKIISALRVGEAVPTNFLSLITMPVRTIERAIAESSLAALRELPSDVAEVRSLESPRWEVVEASMAYNHRYESNKRGILLVRDKEQDNWRSILDCPFTDILKLQDNTLLFRVYMDCDRSKFNESVKFRLNLITMQAITMSMLQVDPEHIDDYQLEDVAVQLDCEQVDPGNIPGMDESALAEDMVLIPGGTFRMGDLSGEVTDDEQPVHSVTVPAFRLGKYEVTFAQWDACVAGGGGVMITLRMIGAGAVAAGR